MGKHAFIHKQIHGAGSMPDGYSINIAAGNSEMSWVPAAVGGTHSGVRGADPDRRANNITRTSSGMEGDQSVFRNEEAGVDLLETGS